MPGLLSTTFTLPTMRGGWSYYRDATCGGHHARSAGDHAILSDVRGDGRLGLYAGDRMKLLAAIFRLVLIVAGFWILWTHAPHWVSVVVFLLYPPGCSHD